ncbi:MAG: hypothetical protein ABSF80_02885 [Chitinispirillaceae bacterium]|jgi:hypothetical protein
MRSFQRVALILAACVFFAAYAQINDSVVVRWKKAMADNDEYIHAILSADRNVIENTKVLLHNLESKKVIYNTMALYHTDEMGRSLHSSDQYLTLLEKATDIAMDEIYVRYLKGLHTHYANALAQLSGIQAELKKGVPEKSVIKMKATVIYAEMKKAEAEQLNMHEKMGVKEPEEPVQNQ